MIEGRLFLFSVIPLLAAFVVAITAGYLLFAQPPEYVLAAWDSLFEDLLPLYAIIVIVFSVGNTVYVTFFGKGRYEVSRNVFYNIAGLILAFLIIINWYVS